MAHSYNSADARVLVKSTKKAEDAPADIEEVITVSPPVVDHCFQPGDLVSFRSNTQGIVLAANGNGVQVDFGLGAGWFTQQSLTLIKATAAK